MRDPYKVICEAAAKGKGCRLTAEEVRQLALDDAIITAASGGADADEEETDYWRKIYGGAGGPAVR